MSSSDAFLEASDLSGFTGAPHDSSKGHTMPEVVFNPKTMPQTRDLKT